jgi:uncharacterized integral membrane protein
MTRIVLVLLIIGGLVLFALQNWSPPIALVILGFRTLALPLGVWVLGAIGAGALTTAVIAGLTRLSRPATRREAPRAAKRPAATAGFSWNPAAKSSNPTAGSSTRTVFGGNTEARRSDDWDSSAGQDDWEDWEDWEESSPRDRHSASPKGRDREDEDWANWEGYEADRGTRQRTSEPVRPPRTDFEKRQEPLNRQQSGSSYSYSYRQDSDREGTRENIRDREPEPKKQDQVYDAEYRVLVPPYTPETQSQPPKVDTHDDEDWGLDEDDVLDDFGKDNPNRR